MSTRVRRVLAVAALVLLSTATVAASTETSGSGWSATIAKTFNFAVLVGGLVYFLRRPIAEHLRWRHAAIRKDLVDAAALRATAEGQLQGVRERLAALPGELDALVRQGQEELAAERARMQEATDRERQRLLDRTRREIALQYRLSQRALVEHVANLAIRLARARIERDMTDDDRTRLLDRFTDRCSAGPGVGGARL